MLKPPRVGNGAFEEEPKRDIRSSPLGAAGAAGVEENGVWPNKVLLKTGPGAGIALKKRCDK